MHRREFLFALGVGWLLPWNWFRPRVRLAEARFREIKRGQDRRRYIWIHGDERTAHDVLQKHMRTVDGRAFLVDNHRRNVLLEHGELDPNRMFSRVGAERSLRSLNPTWDDDRLRHALDRLDRDRPKFVDHILPSPGGLLVALHNNGPGYSVKDEVDISDAVAMNAPNDPDEFMLCTWRDDFERLSKGSYNVLLQDRAPKDDDGSLSRLCAARGVRYVNIEAAHGNRARQQEMLDWLEKTI